MNTPVRAIRIEDDLWKCAVKIADDLKAKTGLSATAADVVRIALREHVDRWKADRKQRKADAAEAF
jgi:hypothetical protein